MDPTITMQDLQAMIFPLFADLKAIKETIDTRFANVAENMEAINMRINELQRQQISIDRGATGTTDNNFVSASAVTSDGNRRVSQFFSTAASTPLPSRAQPSVSNSAVPSALPSTNTSVNISQYTYLEHFKKTYEHIDTSIFIDVMLKDFHVHQLNFPHNAAGEIRPFGTLGKNAQEYFWSRLNIGLQQNTFSPRATALMPQEREGLLALNIEDFTVLLKEVVKPFDKQDVVRKIHEVISRPAFPTARHIAVLHTQGHSASRTAQSDFWLACIETLKFYHKAVSMLLETVEEKFIPKNVDKDGHNEHLNAFTKGKEGFKGLETFLRDRWGDFFSYLKSESFGASQSLSRRDEFLDLLSRLLITAIKKQKEAVAAMPALEEANLIARMPVKSQAHDHGRPSSSFPHRRSTISSALPPETPHEDEWDYSQFYGYGGDVTFCDDDEDWDEEQQFNDAFYSMTRGRQQTEQHPASSLRAGSGKPQQQLFDHHARSLLTGTGRAKKDMACYQVLHVGSCGPGCFYSHEPLVLYDAAKRLVWHAEYLAHQLGVPSPSAAFGPTKTRALREPGSVKKSIMTIPKPADCPPEDYPFATAFRPSPSSPRPNSSFHAMTPRNSGSSPSPTILSRSGANKPAELDESDLNF